ncbi:polysaccharide deacetylase family protein [Gelidibacter salicanalis]|uniref:polysaccharide deacetylase family protein n=1 Tax=Gelidibacter salicanalis TaxID=291193 RepID=UPI001FEA9AB1|nr:polysaccharide deacetylase family protein [Gelidibacter salicanalis]
MIKGIFPKYTWNMPEDQKILYLTFDDGPTPEITNWTLDLLKSYDAQATFFCIGNNIQQHPEIFQNLLDSEHAIGNHTYNHPYGWRTKTEAYVAEVLKTEQVMSAERGVWSGAIKGNQSPNLQYRVGKFGQLNKTSVTKRHVRADQQPSTRPYRKGTFGQVNNPPVPKRHFRAGQQPARTEKARSGGSTTLSYRKGTFGRPTHLFRPPYGQIKPSQGKQLLALGYQIIMWDILSFDWKASLSKEACARNVISKAGPGSIVVFHDSVKAAPRMKHALKATLAHFSAQGYQFKSIEF